jgi:hypothetical protein
MMKFQGKIEFPCNGRVAGIILRAIRTEQGLTPNQMGRTLGTRPSAITNRELNGLCTLRAVEDYFNTLGYDVSIVLTEKKSKNR